MTSERRQELAQAAVELNVERVPVDDLHVGDRVRCSPRWPAITRIEERPRTRRLHCRIAGGIPTGWMRSTLVLRIPRTSEDGGFDG